MARRGPYDGGSSDRRRGLDEIGRAHFWSDLHHRALTIGWPGFFAAAVAIFLTFNLIFAALYGLGTAPIANVSPAGYLGLFYFSIETLATVGYGDMHPQTNWGHAVATVEIFTGMSLMAVMTGLVFTRFSQPRARFVFARHPVVAPHDGVSTLMLRLANARGNVIVGATAKLWLVRNETTREGNAFRRIHELGLVRRETPSFVLSWTLLHPIDAASPLAGMTAADLAATDGLFIVTISGHDETIAQEIHARHSFPHGAIRWGHRYVDILSTAGEGRVAIDTTRIHDTVATDLSDDAASGGG